MIWKQKQLKSKKSKKSANSVEIKDDPKIEETAESTNLEVMKEGEKIVNEETAPIRI
jgi:hypothetical protein